MLTDPSAVNNAARAEPSRWSVARTYSDMTCCILTVAATADEDADAADEDAAGPVAGADAAPIVSAAPIPIAMIPPTIATTRPVRLVLSCG
jgi:hypothetical protein